MEQLAIMQGLTAAYTIIRNAQFGMASTAPAVWDMLQRMLKENERQQSAVLTTIREA